MTLPNVLLYKLITGEEVIGTRVEGEQSFVVEIGNPYTVLEMFNPQGAALMLRPFFRGSISNENLMLQKTQVLTTPREPAKHLLDAYLQQVSGIILERVQ